MKKLGGEDAALRFLRGELEVITKKHVIDCDADPFVPEDCKVEEHIKGGQFKWEPAAVNLYLSKEQKKGVIEGHDLRKELRNKPVLNANVLDYLLAHPELIPPEE